MTKKNTLLFIVILLGLTSFVQSTPADRLIGMWVNEEKDAKIEIYKTGNKFFGKIVDATDLFEADGKTLRKDEKNQDPKLKTRALQNLVILTDFVYDDGTWENGKIYDPKSGKTYNSIIKLDGNKLQLRGYIGVSLFGRTTVWLRDN